MPPSHTFLNGLLEMHCWPPIKHAIAKVLICSIHTPHFLFTFFLYATCSSWFELSFIKPASVFVADGIKFAKECKTGEDTSEWWRFFGMAPHLGYPKLPRAREVLWGLPAQYSTHLLLTARTHTPTPTYTSFLTPQPSAQPCCSRPSGQWPWGFCPSW